MTVVLFPVRQARCPDCLLTRIEERQPGTAICANRFHDRIVPWKGWTP